MNACKLEDQVNWLGELVCAWMIINEPVSVFDELRVSMSVLLITWVASIFFIRVLRVVCRSLALALAFCGDPVPLPMAYPMFVPVLLPGWKHLFVQGSYEGPAYFSRLTFVMIFVVAVIFLGVIEWRRSCREAREEGKSVGRSPARR